MNKYHIRFNTGHNGSDLVWRVFENGQEHLVKSFKINVPVFDEITVEDDITKWNICCYGQMTLIDGVAKIDNVEVKTQQCSIKISNSNVTYNDYKEFDAAIEEILCLKYGEEFVFEFDVWWRQSNIDYRVKNYPLHLKVWDPMSKSSTTIWETDNSIDQFVKYFFNHDMFLKFKDALTARGWTISGPDIEI